MSLEPSQLKAPEGELEDFMFPAGDIDTRIAAWLEEAADKVATLSSSDQDNAARAWVYYRGFKAFVLRVTATPAKRTMDSGKTEYEFTSEQIRTWKAMPDYWLGQFQGYFSTTPVSVAVGKMKDPTPKGTVFI
jgi:hypothetical protein